MNDYRERLELAWLLRAFERAREAKSVDAMRAILEKASFKPLEIDSILWSKGENVARAPTQEEKEKRIWDAVVGRLGTALLSGVILGGVFVGWSSGYDENRDDNMEVMMKDYRTPMEAYYRPFIWGFSIGALGGLVTGTLMYDPTKKKA
jgi:hypothetical protein